jgi:hypothetical protein
MIERRTNFMYSSTNLHPQPLEKNIVKRKQKYIPAYAEMQYMINKFYNLKLNSG